MIKENPLLIQGFLQDKLIVQIDYKDLQNFQAQGQGAQNNVSQLHQNSRERTLNKVKVSYNRPKIGDINLTSSILNFSLKNLPDVEMKQEDDMIKKQDLTRKRYQEQIDMISSIIDSNNQQNIVNIKPINQQQNNVNPNQPHWNSAFGVQNNQNNNANLYQDVNGLKFNSDFNQKQKNNNDNNSNSMSGLFGTLKNLADKFEPSSYFILADKDVKEFSRETGEDYEFSKQFILKHGSYEKALQQYPQYLEEKFSK